MAASVLNCEGWNVSDDAYQRCLEKANNKAGVTNVLLNTDIKDVAVASLPADFAKSKPTKLSGPLVLQIQKIRNISAPTTRQESATAPRMFRFSLSDGFQNIPAIELESLHNVGFGTAPGSKLLLKGTANVNQGIALLTNGNCKLLGGKVEVMYERWQLNKDLMKLSRNTNRSDGPPPFVPFGQKLKRDQIQNLTGKFNSLEVASANPTAVERDNAEFDAQRQAVITEALQQQQQQKKYGGIKQVDAEAPLERAEYKRPERKPKKSTVDDKDPNVSDDEDYGRGRGRKGRRGRNAEDGDEHLAPGRPSAANTLFDFLGDRFVGDEEGSKTSTGSSTQANHHDGGYDRRANHKHNDPKYHGSAQGQRSGDNYRQHSHTATDYNRHDSNRQYNNPSTASDSGRRFQANRQNVRGSEHPNHRYSDTQSMNRDNSNYHSQSKSYGNHARNSGSASQQRREDKFHPTAQRGDNSHSTAQRGGDSHSAAQRGDNSHSVTQRGGNSHSAVQKEGDSHSTARRGDNSHSGAHRSGNVASTSGRSSRAVQDDSSKTSAAQGGGRFAGKMYSDDVRSSVPASNAQATAAARQQSGAQSKVNPTLACNPGDVVLAKYWEDGQFYRFKILAQLSHSAVRGIFLDYGNTEEVNTRDIRPVSVSQRHTGGALHRQQQQRPGSTRPQVSEYEGDYSQGLSFGRRDTAR